MVAAADEAGDAVFMIEPVSGAIVVLPYLGGVVEVEAGIVEGGVEGDVADVVMSLGNGGRGRGGGLRVGAGE